MQMKLWTAIVAALCVGGIRAILFFLGEKFGLSMNLQIHVSWSIVQTAVFIISIIAFVKIALQNAISKYVFWSISFMVISELVIISVDYTYNRDLLYINNWGYATLLIDFIAGILFASTFKVVHDYKIRLNKR